MISQKIDVLKYWGEPTQVPGAEKLQLLRLGPTQTALRVFTSETVPVRIHYMEERDLNSFCRCNGDSCVLCQAGRNLEERVLLPVYVLNRADVEILPVSPSSRPGALRPQILPLLQSMAESTTPVVALASKPDRMTFKVTRVEANQHHCLGDAAIKKFMEAWEAGQIDPVSVYQKMDNAVLSSIPGVATKLAIKGATPSGNDQRE
jgi:hypothetical protein